MRIFSLFPFCLFGCGRGVGAYPYRRLDLHEGKADFIVIVIDVGVGVIGRLVASCLSKRHSDIPHGVVHGLGR